MKLFGRFTNWATSPDTPLWKIILAFSVPMVAIILAIVLALVLLSGGGKPVCPSGQIWTKIGSVPIQYGSTTVYVPIFGCV